MSDRSDLDVVNFPGRIRLTINPEQGRDSLASRDFQKQISVAAYLAGAEGDILARLSEGELSIAESASIVGRVYLLAIYFDLLKYHGLELDLSYVEIWEGSVRIEAGTKSVKKNESLKKKIIEAVVIVSTTMQGIAAAPTVIHDVGEVVQVVQESASRTVEKLDEILHNSSTVEVMGPTD